MKTISTLRAIVGWPLIVVGALGGLLGLVVLIVGGRIVGPGVVSAHTRVDGRTVAVAASTWHWREWMAKLRPRSAP